MIRNTLAATLVAYAILAGVVLEECAFLAPYRHLIWIEYGEKLLWFSGAVLFNMFAAFYVLLRKLALKDTGDKLSHVEKQLRGPTTISRELTERILAKR